MTITFFEKYPEVLYFIEYFILKFLRKRLLFQNYNFNFAFINTFKLLPCLKLQL